MKPTQLQSEVLAAMRDGCWLSPCEYGLNWMLFRWNGVRRNVTRILRRSTVRPLIDAKLIVVRCPAGEHRTRYVVADDSAAAETILE
jgi:hypothetical protein